MCNLYLLYICRVYFIFNLNLFLQYQPKTFLDFINDDCVKDNHEIINNNSIDNKIEIKNISLIKKQNENYKKKIIELKNQIKKLKLIIKKKDNEIKELKNIPNKNNYINRIKELEKEIEKYKNYCLLPGEELITIKFISIDQAINFNTFAKKTDNFTKLESSLYENYPKYKDTENYFLVNGKKVNRYRTLDENKINDNDILTLGVIDE